MLVHLYALDDVGSHGETVLQFGKGRQEHLLDNLKVAEIACRQIVHYELNLCWQTLQLVGLGAYQLKYVGVFLVWHDRGTGGAFLWQFHKGKVLTVEHAGVECQLSHGASHRSKCKCHIALHLATSHLSVNHIIVHRVETKQSGCHLAVQGERRAITCCRAKRVAVGHAIGSKQGYSHAMNCAIGSKQEEHVVGKRLSMRAKPQAEGTRHGYLQMCVARHKHVLVLLALLLQFAE